MKLLSVLVCLSVVFLLGAQASGTNQNDDGFPMERLRQKAKAAKESEPQSVRALVDEVFDRTLLVRASERLRDRIFRADIAFRRGKHRAISEDDVVTVVNEFAIGFNAPPFIQTDTEQLHAFREMVRQLVPHFGAEDGRPRLLGHDMTPVEVTFVIASLGEQKLFLPEYRVKPATWTKRYHELKEKHDKELRVKKPKKGEPVVRGTVLPEDTTRIVQALEQDLANDDSELTAIANEFLDRLGIDR